MENKLYPKVSVIIPCYNRERFIAETVNSVLNQTWSNIELIVVDDGCSDGSRKILENFGDRLTILEHPGGVNRGQSASINLGIQKSSGEYIAILDSDDLFLNDKIDKQVHCLIANPEIGLVYANGYAIDENNNKLYMFYDEKHIELSNPNNVLLNCYFLLPNNSLLRKNIFDLTGLFDENLRAAQDHDMAIRVSEVTKIMYIPDVLFYYRRHKDSISFRNVKIRWKNGYKILIKAFKRYPYKYKTIFGRLAVLNFRMGQCLFEDKRYVSSILMFIAAGICDPIRSFKVLLRIESISSPH